MTIDRNLASVGPVEEPSAVLLVDDEVEFARAVADALQGNELVVHLAYDWESALDVLDGLRPSLIILDQWLGRLDAVPRIPKLRERTNAPIVLLTGNRLETDRIVALELGADDFLQKPISMRELLARIRAHLRRGPLPGPSEAGWRIAHRDRKLYAPNGEAVPLTHTEFLLLRLLAARVGETVPRETLLEEIQLRPLPRDDRTLDNHIYNLRRKLRAAGAGDVIGAVRGRGFFFSGFTTERRSN